MLILLISWSILLILCLIISEWLRIRGEDLFIRFFLGLAVLSVYLQLWAIFLPVKYSLLPILLLISYTFFRKRLRKQYKKRINQFVQHINVKGVLILLALLFIASIPTYFNDDGAYYQQTIKWFSEFGFVKGLANIKIHFGLGSSWHIISSAFYIEDLPFTRYYNFNGLVLWMLIISLLRTLSERFKLITLTILFALGALLVNAPSPDLVVLAGTVWLLLNIKNIKPLHLAIIIGFLITVKVTAAGLLIFFLPLYPKLNTSSRLLQVLGVLSVFAILLIIRNIILTGYPLFPLIIFGGFGEYQVPGIIIENFRLNIISEAFDKFHLDLVSKYDLINNYWDRFKALFQVRNYKVLMNIFCLLAFTVTPLLLIKRKQPAEIFIAAGIFLNGIFWFWQAPGYRFVLGYVIFMFYLLIDKIIVRNNIIKLKNGLFAVTLAAVIILNVSFNHILYIIDCGEKKDINPNMIFYPVSYSEIDFITKNGFNITECAYCFNVPVPCYSEPVMNSYIRRLNFDVVLQDPEDISEGFKMKGIK